LVPSLDATAYFAPRLLRPVLWWLLRGSFYVGFIYLKKCQKPVLPWLFLIFRDKLNGARVILQKCCWKPIY